MTCVSGRVHSRSYTTHHAKPKKRIDFVLHSDSLECHHRLMLGREFPHSEGVPEATSSIPKSGDEEGEEGHPSDHRAVYASFRVRKMQP